MCLLSYLSCVWLFGTLWAAWSRQAPPSMGFSRQEYWSGLPCLPQGRSNCVLFPQYLLVWWNLYVLFWILFSSILLWQFFLSTLGINHPTFSWPSRFLLRDLLRSKWRLFSKFQGFCIVSLFVFSTCCLKVSLFFFDFCNFIINVCCRGLFRLIWFGHL